LGAKMSRVGLIIAVEDVVVAVEDIGVDVVVQHQF